jgi:Protein of unknown function (DUF2917)
MGGKPATQMWICGALIGPAARPVCLSRAAGNPDSASSSTKDPAMHTTPQPTRLFPLQTRLIHASAGMRLRVVSGRLWLTQPNVAQDLFLGPGSVIDLLQDWVVIGADAEPAGTHKDLYSEYLLVPLVEPAPSWFQRLRKSRIANRVRSGVSVIW